MFIKNRIPICFVSILFIISSAVAAPQNSVAGAFEGAIEVPGSPLRISIEVTSAPDGKLSATITIPQQGAKDLPLANVKIANSEFTFELPGVPGDPKYRGKLSSDTNKIEGTFMQGGASFPCNLTRKADSASVAKEAFADFDSIAMDAIKKFDVPGMAMAVVSGKDIIYAKGFGLRDVEKKLPATPDTLFAIGSSSKAFTTFVLGTLADQGLLEWDKPVRNYIPWFKLYDSSMGERLTVRDSVTHRSGLPRHDLVWYNNYTATRESLVRRLPFLEPSADLREKWQYNNLMFLTAGYLIETVTGKSWEENVRERIFSPLGMKRANFSIDDSQKDADFAEPYEKKDEKIVKMPFRRITNMGPAGSINASVREMANWLIVHLNDGKFGSAKLIESSTLDEMHKAQMTTGIVNERADILGGEYGMGWFIDNYRGHLRVGHGGNIDGFSANVILFPKDNLGIVILTNLNGTAICNLIPQVVADRLLKLEANDWIGQAAAQRATVEEAMKEGEKKKGVARIAGTSPSHKIEDYAGEYTHPGYGSLTIALRDGKLESTYNGIATPLDHWHYDTFSGGKGADSTFEDLKYTFQTNVNGYIARIVARFEPAVKEIVFTKKTDARLSDPDYIERFTGAYDLLGRTMQISRKLNILIAKLPGQPPYELAPALGGHFVLKVEEDIGIHFTADDKGNITSLDVHQSGAVLTAKRKN